MHSRTQVTDNKIGETGNRMSMAEMQKPVSG